MESHLKSELANLKGSLTRQQATLVAFFLVIFAVIFTILYVENETPTWFWDYANYHEKYKDLIRELQNGVFPFLRFIRESVLHSQHNVTPVVPLLMAHPLLGSHRVGYILSLVILYLLPGCLFTAALARFAWRGQGSTAPALAVTGFSLLYTPYWAPTLRGHPDIVCVLPLASAAFLLLRSRYLLRTSPTESALIGTLLWSSFLLRRHTLFTVVALLAATILFAGLVGLGALRIKNRPSLRSWLLSLACLLLAMAVPALIFQHAYIQEILTPSYSSTFAAYRQSLLAQLEEIYRFFGPVLLGSAAVGGVLAFARGRDGILFCGLVVLLAFLGFQKAQAPSDHHLLILSLFLFPLACAPFVILSGRFQNPWRRLLVGAWFLIPTYSFSHTFPLTVRAPTADDQSSPLAVLAPPRTYPPLRLASYPQVKQLVQALRRLALTKQEKRTIAILASSDQLNRHIVRALGRNGLRDQLVSVSDVDLRDAFQLRVLEADYLVACHPPAIHLGESHQQVIAVPSKALLAKGNPLHRAYRRLPGLDQRLADGTTASIYERIRPPSEAEVAWLHTQFQRFYPTWRRYPTHIGMPRGGL